MQLTRKPRKLLAVLRLPALLVAVWASIGAAHAHVPSKSYLSLAPGSNSIAGRWDISLADLQGALPLDKDHDGILTGDEIAAGYTNITGLAFSHLKISVDGREVACRVTSREPVLDDFSDGTFVKILFTIENVTDPRFIQLNYSLFFETNSLHRGMLQLDCGGRIQTAVFDPDRRMQSFECGKPRPGRQFLAFLREGIFHIWTGYDHVLFLLALLLPAVLRREGGKWEGLTALRPAFVNVFKIVTAFTLAHSVTLALATLQIVRLPSRLTESVIAASVVLAAANNLWPLVRERGWIVAFVFGLIHGFGFANALADLGLVHGALAMTLVGFNLGVETGQLAIVAVFLPVAFALRQTWFYQNVALRWGSMAIMVVAGLWFAGRALDAKLLPF